MSGTTPHAMRTGVDEQRGESRRGVQPATRAGDVTEWATRRLAHTLRGLQRAAVETLTGMVAFPDACQATTEAMYGDSRDDDAPDDASNARGDSGGCTCCPDELAADDAPDETGEASERDRASRRGRRGRRGGRRHKRRPIDDN